MCGKFPSWGQIKSHLSEEEAEDCWGPGVFLVTGLSNVGSSLTAQAAFWAGSLEPHKRGEPFVNKTANFLDLTASVRKAASIQVMYESDALRRSPMSASINPAQLTPFIHGLMYSLKMCIANTLDHTQAAHAVSIAIAQVQLPQQLAHVTTWSEAVQEVVDCEHRMG